MPSKRTLEWREKNKEKIAEWRQRVQERRDLANLENWSYERLEIEIAQLLYPKLRVIYDYAINYTRRHKSGQFRELMANAVAEISEFGTIEPSRFNAINKAIEGAKRRINAKK
jgi:hypothetical protein